MLLPEEVIAKHDDALLKAGEDIIIRRKSGTGGATIRDVTVRAKVRGVSAKQIIGTIAQTDLYVIISPTEILAKPWPDATAPTPGATDPRIPRSGDFAVIKGKERSVRFADPIFVANQWVRCNMIVAG